jgi:hypothetical protein
MRQSVTELREAIRGQAALSAIQAEFSKMASSLVEIEKILKQVE